MSPRAHLLFVAPALAFTVGPAVAAPIVSSASGPDAASITATVTAFQNALGNPNNGNAAGPLAGGRREIDWDGGGGVSTTASALTPFNGFLNNRGALFTTPGTGFLQATPAGLDTAFARTDNLYATSFAAFSPLRVFTPVGSNITDTTFFIPGSNGTVPATVAAFGAVFSDVDTANVTSLEFFNENGTSLGSYFVPSTTGDRTFSFLGVRFDAGERIGRVRITTGNQILGGTNTLNDQVVMDDFIYSEPQVIAQVAGAVPEPASLLVLGVSVVGLAGWRVRKQRAG